MPTVKENLIAARALIDTPEKWAHENKNRVAKGGKCLCAVDALNEVGLEPEFLDQFLPYGPETWAGSGLMIPTANFNDHPDTTHTDIMAVIDRAIAAAE